jgi:3-oxoacyl-[acyl-carrier protein] reductase
MPNYPELRDRVVAITGAASGIGETSAWRFAAQGSRLALLDLDLRRAEALAGGLGTEAFPVEVDVTSRGAAEAAVASVLERFGRIDVLVNCAGGYHAVLGVEQTDEEEWDRIIELNLKSVYLLARAVMPTMKAQRYGRIVNISSQAGRAAASTTSVSYAVAKAGVIHLTRFLALELGPYNITVNAVAPGTTLTSRVSALRTDEQVAQFVTQTPLQRMALPEDQAEAIVYLSSDAASFISGVVLDVNGGRIMV